MSTRILVAALSLIGLPAAAQQVTETSLPLADPDASSFRFIGNIGLAIDYAGGGKVTARVNAYDLSRLAPAWHQEIRVQDSDKSPGNYLTAQPETNRLYFGNGPLTAVEATTGRILWSLDCKTAGSIDLQRARQFADGMLLRGTQDCGDLDKVRILRVDLATGAVQWSADADAHRYKTGKDNDHRDFVMYYEQSSAADLLRMAAEGDSAAVDSAFRALTGGPGQLILAGERLQAVDYASGRTVWSVREKPGRWAPLAPRGLSLWVDDDKLVGYSTRDGSKAFTYDLKAPWGFFYETDTTPNSDLLIVTWKNAHRIDRSGRPRWSVNRADETWGQEYMGSLLMMAMKPKHWAAIDVATGQVRWTAKLESEGDARKVVEELSPSTGVVMIQGITNREPKSLTAFDATTGQQLYVLERSGKAKLDRFSIVDGTRLVVGFEGQPASEYDLRTGTAKGSVAVPLTVSRSRVNSRVFMRLERAGLAAVADDGSYAEYTDEVLTCYGPDGQARWTRKGELSENGRLAILPQGVVVWPVKNGKVELIGLRSGATLYTAMGNAKPRAGVDYAGGHVLVPSGKSIKILTVTGTGTH